MPRESIAMERAELISFLAGVEWMVLATLAEDGTPTGEFVPCALEGEALLFAVPPGSVSARNIERDPRVCCATDTYPIYYEIKGASLHGSARAADRRPGLGADADRTFAVPLDDVLSFDFAKITNKY